MGLIAFIKRLFYISNKVLQNKTEQIKYNDINKRLFSHQTIVPQKRLWFQHTNVNKAVESVVCRVIYNSFKLGSTNQNQELDPSIL